MFDLEMIKQIGYCHGIENYSRHFSGRLPGEAPPTLLDYLPHDALMFIDESHQTIPQLQGMYHGDRSRKDTLVEYGFRLPERARQPAADVRRVREPRQSGGLCLGDARAVRADEVGGCGGGADHPSDGSDRSGDRDPADPRAGGRSAERDPPARRSATSACSSRH